MKSSFDIDLSKALITLRKGGVILYPTDTIWGLGCDATNEMAIERIFTIKQRSQQQPLLILVDSLEMLRKQVDCKNELLMKNLSFHEPTTVIFPKKQSLPDNLTGFQSSIAIRLVDEPFCNALIRQLGRPLVSTSANISGQKSPALFSEIMQSVIRQVDYVVQYRQDDKIPAQPSAIVKIKDGKLLKIR